MGMMINGILVLKNKSHAQIFYLFFKWLLESLKVTRSFHVVIVVGGNDGVATSSTDGLMHK